MARSLKKGPYIELKLETKVLGMAEGKIKKGVIK
jgi:small subunit ribosomal protein S19